ncbi:MAG: hypothetical protein SFX73_25710 [Kofleriaceae bacterium]|nr:hypothetical protein [Kofleriaceae bacterium]
MTAALCAWFLMACDGADASTGHDADANTPLVDAAIDAEVLGDSATDASSGLPPGPSSARQVPRPLGTTSAANGYYEYLPPGYGNGDSFPLLVFWHGLLEGGNGTTELSRVLGHGPPQLIANDQWPDARPFVVLSPQHGGGGCPTANEIHAFIAYAASAYQVDPQRLYLTGLSCGAIGSWDYLSTYLDEQIAAMVPVCGNGQGAWSNRGCDLGRVAIWAFHGDVDDIVPVAGSTTPLYGLAGCASPPRKDALLTLYQGVGHNSWTQTYDLSAGHDIYAWLLTHHK